MLLIKNLIILIGLILWLTATIIIFPFMLLGVILLGLIFCLAAIVMLPFSVYNNQYVDEF